MGAAGRTGLTVVGQVVGSYFGPIGSAIGGMIGSAIGGALWPEQIEGPRLEGLQITSSSYGWPIPEVYGTVRTAGNIVWRYPLDTYYEVATTESAGKGGGPEVTTYTYYLDFAVLLCEGPVAGIRRIWADQKLIYDVSAEETTTLPDGTLGAIGATILQLVTSQNAAADVRMYLGTEDQLPDPTIEAQLGVGNTPAYRGYCYLVFPRFNLSEYGNRIPNITVEVVKGGTATGPQVWYRTNWNLPYESDAYAGHVRLISADGVLTAVPGMGCGLRERAFISDLDGGSPRAVAARGYGWPSNSLYASLLQQSLLLWNGAAAVYAIQLPGGVLGGAFSVRSGELADAETMQYSGTGTDWSSLLSDGGKHVVALIPDVNNEHLLTILGDGVVTPTDWVLYRFDGGFTEIDRGTVEAGTTIFHSAGTMRSINGGIQVFYCGVLESDLRHVWQGTSAGFNGVYLFEIGDDGVLRFVQYFEAHASAALFSTVTIYADAGVCWYEQGGYLHAFYRIPTLPLDYPTLAEVVASICAAGGLAASDIDVTDLVSQTVRGYLRSARMPGRAALEPLMTAYAFDAVESDLKIKFRRRGATVDVVIPADDLGAAEGGDAAAVETERVQESELPQAIDLSYIDADADYQVGTQIAQRLAVNSEERLSVRLAVALQAWQAAEIVNRMLFELWVARSTRKFSTTIKYAKYEPTDVITVAAGDASYTVRALDKRERGQAIEWSGVDVDAAGFVPAATAAVAPGGGTLATIPAPTAFVAADLPPLREADFDTFGWYVGGAGLGGGTWPGATVYSSVDGVTFDPVVSLATPAAVGATTGVLGRWGYSSGDDAIFAGYTVDFQSFVEVTLAAGTLASCTFDELLALTNVALIGDEIVAFKSATLVATGVYRLSGFLRGLQGTEMAAAAAAGHVAGERFLLLTAASLQRVTDNYAAALQDLQVKAVTAGRALTRTTAEIVTRSGASAVPPAPTHTVGRQSGSDLVVAFTRRSHVGGTWDSGRDVPALATEEYAIRVRLASGAAKTFFRSGPAPHTITAAELATIGGTVSGVAFFVAQVPPATPGSTVLLGTPTTRPAFWSRRTSVTWT